MSDQEFLDKFRDLTRKESVDEQAMSFLRAFVGEFQGKFEEILKLAEEFKKFAVGMRGHVQELDEFEAHRFLEVRGEAQTAAAMRDAFKEIDIDRNHKVSFIEYLLFKHGKTPKDLFTARPNENLLKKLEAAIEQYKSVLRAKEEREHTLEELRKKASSGDVKAKAELKRMEGDDPAAATKDEVSALHAKLAAKRALKNPQEEEQKMYEEEQRRIAEEKAQAEAREKADKEASRQRLKEKAALWK